MTPSSPRLILVPSMKILSRFPSSRGKRVESLTSVHRTCLHSKYRLNEARKENLKAQRMREKGIKRRDKGCVVGWIVWKNDTLHHLENTLVNHPVLFTRTSPFPRDDIGCRFSLRDDTDHSFAYQQHPSQETDLWSAVLHHSKKYIRSMYRIVSKWNRFVPDTRTIDFVYTHTYIYSKRRWSFSGWHKNGIVERRWFIPLISNHANLNDDQRFSCKMGGREGLLLADGFICLLFLALRGYRSIRSNRWKFAKGQRCFSPFLSLLFFSLFGRRIGHDNDRFIGSRTHKRLAFRLAAKNKNLLSLLPRLDEHPSAIVLRDRTRNFARISSHRHCFLR